MAKQSLIVNFTAIVNAIINMHKHQHCPLIQIEDTPFFISLKVVFLLGFICNLDNPLKITIISATYWDQSALCKHDNNPYI